MTMINCVSYALKLYYEQCKYKNVKWLFVYSLVLTSFRLSHLRCWVTYVKDINFGVV